MSERPVMPPLFHPLAVTPEIAPFERGLQAAAEGAEAGTVLWSIGQETCQAAVVLAPEHALEAAMPIVLVAMLGLGDALGALLPPVLALTFGWPDRIEVNGGVIGGVRMASAPIETTSDVPDWIVVGYGIAARARPGGPEPGHGLGRTTLADEGCEVACMDLVEAFGRHFLSWINRWQDDGVAPVRQAWLSRASGLSKPVEIDLGEERKRGRFTGLTESGAMRLVEDGVAQTVSLEEAVRVASWRP